MAVDKVQSIFISGIPFFRSSVLPHFPVSPSDSLVLFPDPPPTRKGESGEYSTSSNYGLAVAMNSAKSQASVNWRCAKEVCKGVMSKAKWFAVRKPATSANQTVLLKF